VIRTMIRLHAVALLFAATRFQLRTLAGRDWQALVMADTAGNGTGAYHAANYLGVTENDDDPDEDNTSLAGEISSGTLVRAQATFAHTTGAASYTLTRTLTSDDNVTLRKIGVFTLVSGGTLVFETRMNEIAVMAPGDQIQITHTVFL
jgi:hypothetical protein